MWLTKASDAVAATDEKALTGDPPRLLGGEEHDYVGHVIWPSHAPERNVLHDRLFRVRGDPPSLDRSWRHDVHGDPVLSELHGGRSAVGLERRFAGSIGHLAWKAVGSVRADIDDPSPACTTTDVPARVLGHKESHGPAVDREVSIMDFRVDHGLHASRPVLPWRGVWDEAVGDAVGGVVDQDIDWTQRLL